MEDINGIKFEIDGNDYINLKKFRKQHENCGAGTCGDQFSYTFVPTSMGLVTSVKCSCGQKLSLGSFMDFDSGEYDEKENKVLTKEDIQNKAFEEAVQAVLSLRNPKLFRIGFGEDMTFDTLHTYVAGLATFADDRIRECILYKVRIDESHREVYPYEGMSESEKIDRFFSYFEEKSRAELDQYDCDNERLLEYFDKHYDYTGIGKK